MALESGCGLVWVKAVRTGGRCGLVLWRVGGRTAQKHRGGGRSLGLQLRLGIEVEAARSVGRQEHEVVAAMSCSWKQWSRAKQVGAEEQDCREEKVRGGGEEGPR